MGNTMADGIRGTLRLCTLIFKVNINEDFNEIAKG